MPAADCQCLLEVLTSNDATRAEAIRNLYAARPHGAVTVELLVDADDRPALRAVLVGILREE